MNELQNDFLNQSISDLEEINKNINAGNFPESLLRDAFRTLHTIKGTAQVFGFGKLANLAHELENLLAAGREKKTPTDKTFYSFLQQGFGYLTEISRQEQSNEEILFPKNFVAKLRLITKNDSPAKDFSFQLPDEILAQLSASEKDSLASATENGKNLFLIEAGFNLEKIAVDFTNFRSILSEAGEIIATFPSSNPVFTAPQSIGFQVFFVTEKSFAEVSRLILPFRGEINFKVENVTAIKGNFSESALTQAVNSAKALAEKSGKDIKFDVSISDSDIPAKHLKILFDALLHLTRNAVDHGIKEKGEIMIRLACEKNGLYLAVSDDGTGIDIEKVRAKAIEKNLIAADAHLSETETLNLIFAHGFSTSETISEISGRGVGLDAVRNLVERAGGKITAKSKKNAGTTFEIFLPNEE